MWFPWFCLIAAKIWSDGQTDVTAQFKLRTNLSKFCAPMNPFLFQWTCCVHCKGFKKSFTCLHYADHIAKITLLISGCIVINKCVMMPVLLKKKTTEDQCYSLVTAQFYLASKGKCIRETWGRANPKEAKRRERLNFGSSFYMFFSPPPEPALCKLG